MKILYSARAERDERDYPDENCYSERLFWARTDTDAETFARFIFADWKGATVTLSHAYLSDIPPGYVANQGMAGGAATIGVAEWFIPA